MKKYLREIEVSGLILVIIGIVISWIKGSNYGMWPCLMGLLLWLITFLYKAFNWNEYARENRQNHDSAYRNLYSTVANVYEAMTIREAQETVDQWIKTYGVRYFSELTNMAVLTEEVGELARVISRRYGDQSWKASDPRREDNGKSAMGEEMADVLWVLLCLANQTDIDLTEELKKSIEKKTKRDKERHINNDKLK